VRDGRFAPNPGHADHRTEVTWAGAAAYCRWRGARLPSEVEWEAAARGRQARRFPWGDAMPTKELAVIALPSGNTVPVGSRPRGATPEGLQDMAGSLLECTSSLDRPYPYRADDGREDARTPGERTVLASPSRRGVRYRHREEDMTNGLDEAVIKKEAIAYWQQGPLNKPVKLTSFGRDPMFWTEGYITCRKFIAGRSLSEAERILGLRAGELAGGAYLYEFLRLPTADEFDLRGYTQTPGGQPWHAGSKYPPGTGAAQWEVRKNTFIASRLIATIQRGQTIP
jgi:formylglycine-generating enzyme required for sulfatase activity